MSPCDDHVTLCLHEGQPSSTFEVLREKNLFASLCLAHSLISCQICFEVWHGVSQTLLADV